MNDLQQLLQRGAGPQTLRQGVVTAVSGGNATVQIGSSQIKARYLRPAPEVGETVLLTYLSNNPVVLGAFAPKATNLADGEGEQDA